MFNRAVSIKDGHTTCEIYVDKIAEISHENEKKIYD
jgi:hypothetical protein